MCKCHFPDGVSIRPDGIHELSPHQFVEKEIHRNVTVQILQCKKCGEISIAWSRQENTEDEIIDDLD